MHLSLKILIAVLPLMFGVAIAEEAETASEYRYSDYYNANTITKITGPVLDVSEVMLKPGLTGVAATIDFNGEHVSAILGSKDYMRNHFVGLEVGREVEVIGSKTVVNGLPTIIADTIIHGERKLAIRDENGFPAWLITPNLQYAYVFQPGMLRNLKGHILGRKEFDIGGGHTGLTVRVNAGGEFLSVFLGDLDYLKAHDISTDVATALQIKGAMARPRRHMKPMFLVEEVKQGDRVVRVRDEFGSPLWRTPTPREYRDYDEPLPLINLTGVVRSIPLPYIYDAAQGEMVELDTGDGSTPVLLASAEFMKAQDMKLLQGDRIKVTGKTVIIDRRPTIEVYMVRRDNTTIRVRDDEGQPLWENP